MSQLITKILHEKRAILYRKLVKFPGGIAGSYQVNAI